MFVLYSTTVLRFLSNPSVVLSGYVDLPQNLILSASSVILVPWTAHLCSPKALTPNRIVVGGGPLGDN